MNFSQLRNFQGVFSSFVKRILAPTLLHAGEKRGIHQICSQYSSMLSATNNQNIFKPLQNFLLPILPQFNQVCGMKQKGVLQLRCKGCYYVCRQGRMYVMCKIAPRHKQMQMMKSFKKKRILTFACQKKIRDW